MELYRLTKDWVESEVTWNEPWIDPGADGPGSHANDALYGDSTSTGWLTFDITAFTQAWSNGALNCGIVLKDSGTDGVDFNSSESNSSPAQTVNYLT